MKEKVIPARPIPGILPKNKYIENETVLDLNKKEMIHCMQYGTLYDENGRIIDKYYLNKPLVKIIKKIDTAIELTNKAISEASVQEHLEQEKIVKDNIVDYVKEETETIIEEIKPEYNINMVSITKDDYITIETEFSTNVEKLEGNLYGLLDITQGPKPTVIEYKSGENWIKFAKKFTDFKVINNGDKFVFRIMPKNGSPFMINLSIKEKNEVVASAAIAIQPVDL